MSANQQGTPQFRGATAFLSAQPAPALRQRVPLAWLLIICTAIVLAGTVMQTCAGSFDMTLGQSWRAIFDSAIWTQPQLLLHFLLGEHLCASLGVAPPQALDTGTLIVWNIRIPRLICGVLVGINLALSGSIFQAITRNEMASPYLLGVSSGAGLAILLVLVIVPELGIHLPLLAMAGGTVAFLIVYLIAWKHGTSPVRLVLAGVIVAAIAGSLQTGIFFLAKDLQVVQNAMEWTTGSLTGSGWAQVRMITPWTLVVIVLSFAGARHLDILLLGDPTASALGVAVEKTRFLLAAVAILAAGSAVSVAGLIGFVGLIVPHIVRSLVGSPHRRVFAGCLFAGPALLVSADTTARLMLSPVQIPVGILTGVFGGGFFLYLMRRKQEFGRL